MSRVITSGRQYYNQTFKQVQFKSEQFDSIDFFECEFFQCSFLECSFNISRFVDCFIKDSDFSLIQIPGTTFSSVRIDTSKVIGINWTQAIWRDSPLGKIPGFYKSILSHSTFLGLDLSDVQIVECVAQDVDFREAMLRRANLQKTDFEQSLFLNTILTEADFRGARNYRIDPSRNRISQAKFSLPEAMGLLYSMDIDLDSGACEDDIG